MSKIKLALDGGGSRSLADSIETWQYSRRK